MGHRHFFSIPVIIFLLISVSCDNPSSLSDTPDDPSIDLTGTWKCFFGWNGEEGLMILDQTGESISGKYTFNNGQLEGTMKADTFTFKWWEFALDGFPYDSAEQHHRGPGFFVVKKAGDSLYGKWCNEDDEEWSSSEWIAVRKSKKIDKSAFVIDTTTSPSAQLTGMWYSEWGDILLTQVGDSVFGLYGQYDDCGRIAGELAGLRLTFSWWEGESIEVSWNESESRGYGEVKVSKDGTLFDGLWRYENSGYWVDSPLWGEKFSDEVDSSNFIGDSDTGKITIPSDPGLYLSSDESNELLFVSKGDDGSSLFFHGTEDNGLMKPTHVIFRDNDGTLSAIIFHDLMPVQWILDSITVAVYNLEDTPRFDPENAFHVIRHGTKELSGYLDIYPSSLDDVIAGIEESTGETYDHVRDFLLENNLSSFSKIKKAAQSKGSEQPLFIRAATGISVAAAVLALQESEESEVLSKSTNTAIAQGLFKYFAKIAASWLANMLADEFGPDFAGNGPTIGVLLCQGAAKYGVCHYMFLKSSELGRCVSICQTSMGCFTNICMPMEIDAEMAGSFSKGSFGGD